MFCLKNSNCSGLPAITAAGRPERPQKCQQTWLTLCSIYYQPDDFFPHLSCRTASDKIGRPRTPRYQRALQRVHDKLSGVFGAEMFQHNRAGPDRRCRVSDAAFPRPSLTKFSRDSLERLPIRPYNAGTNYKKVTKFSRWLRWDEKLAYRLEASD